MTALLDPAKPGLLLMEHLNLNVTSTEIARAFYIALGCVKDANKPPSVLHSHCGGLTQFHTALSSEGSQKWRGQIELLYSGRDEWQAAREKLQALLGEADFKSTKLALGEPSGDGDDVQVEVVGPYGNRFVLRVASAQRGEALGTKSGQRPGSEGATCLSIGGVTLEVPVGTAERGARFYSEVMGFNTREVGPGKWAVLGGPGNSQSVLLEEKEGATGKEVGEHMAIYIGDCSGCFNRLLKLGLIWVNPRFLHLDNANTLEEALHYQSFRFREVVDPSTGEKLFELEHETRSALHKGCALAYTRTPTEARLPTA